MTLLLDEFIEPVFFLLGESKADVPSRREFSARGTPHRYGLPANVLSFNEKSDDYLSTKVEELDESSISSVKCQIWVSSANVLCR